MTRTRRLGPLVALGLATGLGCGEQRAVVVEPPTPPPSATDTVADVAPSTALTITYCSS